ncbi:hypothetical protein QTP86_024060, partial [Hemibagrus guttatus]
MKFVLTIRMRLLWDGADPLHFSYQPQLGVEDAIIHLLDRIYTHSEKPASSVRFMFFDFSSAFNTIRPTLLGEKLKNMNVYTHLVSWIMDYLTRRPQYIQNCISDTTRNPATFRNSLMTVGCIQGGNTSEYQTAVDNFVTWCELNHLQLSVGKTKELVVDFRKSRTPVSPLSVHGEKVEIVEDYKYLGVHIDNKLDWTLNSTALYKK